MGYRFGGLCIPFALLAASAVWAHPLEHPKLLRLGVKDSRLLLAINFDVNPGAASRKTRALFDADASGALDFTERAKLERFLESSANLWLELSVDGQKRRPERLEAKLRGADVSMKASRGVGLELLYGYALPENREVTLVIRDRDRDDRIHVPLDVDVGAGWSIVSASQGEIDARRSAVTGIRLERDRELILRLRRANIPRALKPPP